jgi:adenine-specific DNA-methyltransferase
MAKINITKTELVWPGKYNEDGTLKEVPRVNLPFQVIETINESRATREAKKVPQNLSLFDIWDAKEGETFEEGWKNKLIWGDNLLVMDSLLEKFAGKIDLIYIDPPFATGADFSFTAQVGDGGLELIKDQSIIEEKAYRDTWGKGFDSYLAMMYQRLMIIKDLLSENGSLFLHCDWHIGHYLKALLDGIFGKRNFRNEIIWDYTSRTQRHLKTFSSKHDILLVFSKDIEKIIFNAIFEPYSQEYIDEHFSHVDENGRRYCLSDGGRGKPRYRRYLDEEPGKAISDVWQIKHIHNWSDEYRHINFPTQKPEALLHRVIESSTLNDSLVGDFFCGSGTTLAIAERLSRRWIGCDLSRWAIHTTRKRLLGLENCKPFEVLNLGKYERKYWMGVTFGDKKKSDQEMVIFQYIAFILKLYSAEPLSGMEHLHGKKGHALLHIGAVDAPVTIDEVNVCIEECLAVGQKELHILGWEWEMGMTPYIVQEAKRRGVKLLLVTIPREVMEEQAIDKGDIRFFEVAHLEVGIELEKGQQVSVNLKDFAFPYAEMIPEDVRDKIKKWSDYIDYWAIDWDFQNDTFMNGWVAYRTRKERKLPLKSDIHAYEKQGKYTIMVKAVDIFGNDTSQTFDVEVT